MADDQQSARERRAEDCPALPRLLQRLIGRARHSVRAALCSRPRRESPQPDTENGCNDERDPAYAHWNGQGSDGDLGLLEQSHQMTNGKDAEKYARHA